MKRVVQRPVYSAEQEHLLTMLGEELKRPLTHISQLAQLGGHDHMIQSHVQGALHTIDSMLLYKRLASGQLELQLEPVHVGSVMSDVLMAVRSQLVLSGCRSKLDIHTALKPVTADRIVLSHALISLMKAYITSSKNATLITCSARHVSGGVRITIHSDETPFEKLPLKRANLSSTQPLQSLAGAATDLLVARGIFDLVGSRLTVSRFKTTNGIGVTLPISKQLRFV